MMDYRMKIEWLSQAIDIIKDHKREERSIFNGTTSLEELELDSLDVVELQMMYEDNFKVELRDSSEPINTVDDLIRLLEVISS